MSVMYPMASQGVFRTCQGEGLMFGVPMVFIRLAGCNVGCPECDTDYQVSYRANAGAIAEEAASTASPGCEWVWITGGEPTIHELEPLYAALRRADFRIALATAGVTRIKAVGRCNGGPDFVSVSPHKIDASWVQKRGDQINIVPGLNGLTLTQLDASPAEWFAGFSHRFVTPCWYTPNGTTNVAEVMDWVYRHPGWRVGIQAHKHWGVK
jgi:7-carboxy-7-deazaguanine synthase